MGKVLWDTLYYLDKKKVCHRYTMCLLSNKMGYASKKIWILTKIYKNSHPVFWTECNLVRLYLALSVSSSKKMPIKVYGLQTSGKVWQNFATKITLRQGCGRVEFCYLFFSFFFLKHKQI